MTLTKLIADRKAASAAEFALVLPLLLILLFGIIDAGRFLWEYNQAEKATQMGIRYAVVTDPVLSGLSSYSFATGDSLTAGSTVPAANFTSASCTSSSCTCVSTTGGFCAAAGLDATAFANVVARMAEMYPGITSANVEVDYKNIGLGYAGSPSTCQSGFTCDVTNPNDAHIEFHADVSPLVTVKLTGLTFRPITCLVFPCSISMPVFTAALTAEDLSGSTGF